MAANSIHEVSQARLKRVLGTSYHEGVTHIELGGTQLSGPFALALYDLNEPIGLYREEFPDTLRVLEVMARRRVAVFGTDGHDQPLEADRYAVPGRDEHLSLLEITAVKAAEMLMTGLPNHLLLLGRDKWPGATASYGGRPVTIHTGRSLSWELGIAGGGFAPECNLLIVDKAVTNLQYELIASGEVVIDPIASKTFLLPDDDSWQYPAMAS